MYLLFVFSYVVSFCFFFFFFSSRRRHTRSKRDWSSDVCSSDLTFENVIGDSVAPRRLSVVLLGVFAGVAVLLASVGIYGVMSFLVVQRTHEIGVRMALGAQRSDVLKLVLVRSLKLISAGTIIGLIVAL